MSHSARPLTNLTSGCSFTHQSATMDLNGLLFIDKGKRLDSLDNSGSKSLLKPLPILVVMCHLFFGGSHPSLDSLILSISPPLKAWNDSQWRKATYFKT